MFHGLIPGSSRPIPSHDAKVLAVDLLESNRHQAQLTQWLRAMGVTANAHTNPANPADASERAHFFVLYTYFAGQ